MARGTVNHGAVSHVFAVVDHDRPDLDEGEEGDVCEFVEREDEWEDVVGDALAEAVDRVEGVRGEGRGHDPFVVRFVQALVEDGVVQAAVDPVDAEIREHQEERELQVVVGAAEEPDQRMLDVACVVVDEAVAAHFGDEEGEGEDGHDRH